MPELPEVETIRRELAPRLLGRRITGADSHHSEKFLPAREVIGATVRGVIRRGKYLLAALSGGTWTAPRGGAGAAAPAVGSDGRELVMHLGMTGRLQFTDAPPPSDRYVRAWWRLDDGSVLEMHDVRRFGRVRLVAAGCYDSIPTLAQLGPEPLGADFSAAGLWTALRQSRRRVKTQLLSQRPVAGLGNIYADEALWRAGINPAKRRISRAEATALHAAIGEVLRGAIARRGTTFRDYRTLLGPAGDNYAHLDCYGRGGEPCRRCGAELRSRLLDARNTTYCPACQL
ncbi:MAG: bifunctional DNA-formamidopyrimidine glycosylase/DNA-(apurinic or apyrimidinic site) lyase [bacterium]|nr:bifunctional DNA-formamidopyrimidine glycosylase/DNA-(apurinic or apyrimidinic site) lyase [bacterium]